MKDTVQSRALLAAGCILLFVLLMALVILVDVRPIGPEGSVVGLSTINGLFAKLLPYRPAVYELSELLGYGALLMPVLFGCLGLAQLVKEKDLWKVDFDLYILALVYVTMAVFYIFFELVIVNYRPVLMEGVQEASFPSSHTMLAVTLLGTAAVQFSTRFSADIVRKVLVIACYVLMAAIVLTRLLSGVHWLTDILGGLLLGAALVQLYRAATMKPYEGKH